MIKKNLNISKFKNGDDILLVITAEEWKLADQKQIPACCFYENEPSNGVIYGKLYNWFALYNARGIAPKG
jgi:hypothetical protein